MDRENRTEVHHTEQQREISRTDTGRNETASFRMIDRKTWPRDSHFEYFRTMVRCGYALTKPMDVTAPVEYAHRTGRSFYACTIWAVSRAVNSMDEMRMMVDADGNPGIWDVSNPSFTIFHKEDNTFSDLWMEYVPDFEDFYEAYEVLMAKYGHNRGIKARGGQPANFFCISSAPWLDYTAYDTYTADGEPHLFPIITMGKYQKRDGLFVTADETARGTDPGTASGAADERAEKTVPVIYTMPVTINISHAAADGYHIGKFYERLACFFGQFEKM